MPPAGAPPEFTTIRDFLRFAVGRFRAAGLAHGHGATSALDEAAFLILETLHLPVDDINPWLDARLTRAECDSLAEIIALRIETRKPAAYLLKRTYMHGVPFYIDERAIVPRSYIGELLFSNLFAGGDTGLTGDPREVASVLDLCTGCGCLAVLAAGIFSNAAIDATDLSKEALDVARINLEQHGLSSRINLFHGDLFKPVVGRRYDLILANPPYVAAAEMAAFPPEYASEPAIAHAGGADGLDIVRRILAAAPRYLNEAGGLLCEIGTGRELLAAEFPDLDFLWLDTEESEGEVFWLTRDAFSA